jgi:hypothetical protein
LFFSEPCLSDDIHRYLWEGYLQSHGVNPFKYAPDAPELVPLRNDVWVRVNNKDASAIYPPLLQAVHAAAFMLFRSAWGFKLLFLLAEAALIWVLLRLLKLYGRNATTSSPPGIVVIVGLPVVVTTTRVSLALLQQHCTVWTNCTSGRAVLALAGSMLQALPSDESAFLLQADCWRHGVASYSLPATFPMRPPAVACSRRCSIIAKWRFNGFLYMQLSEQLKDERQARLIFLVVRL